MSMSLDSAWTFCVSVFPAADCGHIRQVTSASRGFEAVLTSRGEKQHRRCGCDKSLEFLCFCIASRKGKNSSEYDPGAEKVSFCIQFLGIEFAA